MPRVENLICLCMNIHIRMNNTTVNSFSRSTAFRAIRIFICNPLCITGCWCTNMAS
jgi:hypothetical protein